MPETPAQKPPRNEHELELKLVRMLGNDNSRMLVMRSLMASAIAGQFLPKGAILKGGGSLRFRFGSLSTRNTVDFDATRRNSLDSFLSALRNRLADGWNGFTGQIVLLPQASPKGIPFEYVMQPVDLKLRYREQPWCTVNLEISHDEAGAAMDAELAPPPEEVVRTFRELGFPAPQPVPLISLEHQIAQKLHGVSSPSERNQRAHDLIDLQIIMSNAEINLKKVRSICHSLFALRKMHSWPAKIPPRPDWEQIYQTRKLDLQVLQSASQAIEWTNALIDKIENSR